MIIRHPHPDEAGAIRALFEDEVKAGRMLPRSEASIVDQLDNWLVADNNGVVIGCVSLVIFNETLCEVRSLAVDPAWRGRGIASQLVESALALAGTRGMRRVLTLTRAAPVFEGIGFQRDFVANFPEKVWRDCAPCPFRHRCDEVALIYELAPVMECV